MSIIRGGIMRSQQALDLSQAIYPRTMHGHTGFRIIGGGNINFDNTTQHTFRAMIEIAAPSFDAVRPIFSTENATNGFTVTLCNARAAANFTSPVGAPTAVTLPGGGVVAAAPATGHKTYLVGDWVLNLPSIPRDDGGTGAIVVFDAYVSTTGNIGLTGGADTGWSYHNYATRARHKHIWRQNAGDCVTTPANFTSTVNKGSSIIVGVEYLHRGRVVTVMGQGDSITAGNTFFPGEGFILPATEKASDLSNITFEYAVNARGSVNSSIFSTFLASTLAAGLYPDILVVPIGSPNDLGSGTMTSGAIATCRRYFAATMKTCSDNSIAPLPWTILPAGAASKNWGASDSLRRDYNAESLALKGMNVLDLAAVLNGALDVNGQVIPLAGTMKSDELHPADYGNSLLANAVAERLLKVV